MITRFQKKGYLPIELLISISRININYLLYQKFY